MRLIRAIDTADLNQVAYLRETQKFQRVDAWRYIMLGVKDRAPHPLATQIKLLKCADLLSAEFIMTHLTPEIAAIMDIKFFISLPLNVAQSDETWSKLSHSANACALEILLSRGVFLRRPQISALSWNFFVMRSDLDDIIAQQVKQDIWLVYLGAFDVICDNWIYGVINPVGLVKLDALYAKVPLHQRWKLRNLMGGCATPHTISENTTQLWPYIRGVSACRTCDAKLPDIYAFWAMGLDCGNDTQKATCRRDQIYALLLQLEHGYLTFKKRSATHTFQRLAKIWCALTIDAKLELLVAFGPALPQPAGTTRAYVATQAFVWAYLGGA